MAWQPTERNEHPALQVEDRESTGWVPSLTTDSPLSYQPPAPTSVGSSSTVNPATSTGSSSSSSVGSNPFTQYAQPLETGTSSSPDRNVPTPMSGRTLRMSMEPDSNSGPNRSNVIPPRTGSLLNRPLGQETLTPIQFPLMYTFDIILHCPGLLRIIAGRLHSNERAMSSGVELELGSHEELGMNRVMMYSVKIRTRSSGMVTEIRRMLLSMNLGGLSQSHTCSGGWIVIRLSWRSRGELCRCARVTSGLHLM